MIIREEIIEELARHKIPLEEFSELLIRLLNNGLLNRDHNQTEQRFYDRYLQIQDLVDEYLSFIGVSVFHDETLEYLRLYPPGSKVPGMDDDSSSYSGGLRAKLTQQEIALVLILRIQYDKAIREGRIDEKGAVTESLESLSISMKSSLQMAFPSTKGDLQNLFHKVSQLRLIDFNKEMLDAKEEAWVRILPTITSFVNDEALNALNNEADESELEEELSEELGEKPIKELSKELSKEV